MYAVKDHVATSPEYATEAPYVPVLLKSLATKSVLELPVASASTLIRIISALSYPSPNNFKVALAGVVVIPLVSKAKKER